MSNFVRRHAPAWIPVLALAAFMLWRIPATAQSTGYVIPNPKFYAADNTGAPCAGCFLYTYVAGSTTPATTYTDVALSIPNTDPITLDSAGRATIYIPAGTQYKFVLESAASVVIWTQDNVSVPSPPSPPAPAAVPTGTLLPYGAAIAPSGYLLADGSAVSRTTYAALFTVIGTIYGSGDGSTTFNVPNMTGRFPFGQSASGTGSTLGGFFGAIDHTHTGAPHTHTFTTASAGAHTHTVPVTGWGGAAGSPTAGAVEAGDGLVSGQTYATTPVTTSSSGAHTHTGTTDAASYSGQTGTANPPGLSLKFIIKT